MDTREQDKKTLGFYRARLEDSDVLYRIPMDSPDRAHNIRRLKDSGVYVFVNDDEDAVLILEPAWGSIPWLCAHCFTGPTGRGRKLKKFFWSTYIWVLENTDYEVITGVVPEDKRYYKLFLGSIGAHRETEILGTAMYSCNSTMVPEFKEKLKALRAKQKE